MFRLSIYRFRLRFSFSFSFPFSVLSIVLRWAAFLFFLLFCVVFCGYFGSVLLAGVPIPVPVPGHVSTLQNILFCQSGRLLAMCHPFRASYFVRGGDCWPCIIHSEPHISPDRETADHVFSLPRINLRPTQSLLMSRSICYLCFTTIENSIPVTILYLLPH